MWKLPLALAGVVLTLCGALPAMADEIPTPPSAPPAAVASQELFKIDSPGGDQTFVGKRPTVTGEFLLPIAPETITVLLDGSDVTSLVVVTGTAFNVSPPRALAAGTHALSVSAVLADGTPVQQELAFATRHTALFEEAVSENEVGTVFETPLVPGDQPNLPDTRIESNLLSQNRIKQGALEASLTTSLRYLDQNRPLPPSGGMLEKGLTLMNYLLTARYAFTDGQVQAEVGNVVVNETQNTVMNLARRGGKLALAYRDLTLASFVVKGENVLGFRGGTGLSGDLERNIAGVSASLGLLDRKVLVQTVFAKGGEPGPSLGFGYPAGAKEGDVAGLVLVTDFWQNLLRTEFEYDLAHFDPDTADEFGEEEGRAWHVRAGGAYQTFNYEALYEYYGRDYVSIGNQMTLRDRQGFALRGGETVGSHGLNLGFSRYTDNVEDDPLLPQIESTLFAADYSYAGLPTVPMGISWQRSLQESARVPEGGLAMDLTTDTLNGRLNFSKGSFNLGVLAGYARNDDQTTAGNDSTTKTLTIAPALNLPAANFMTNLTYNRQEQEATGDGTDSYNFNLVVNSRFFRERLALDCDGNFSVTTNDASTLDQRTFIGNVRLAYSIADLLKGYLRPSIALRGTYTNTTDRISHFSDQEDFSLFLVLAAAVPFAF